MLGKVSTAEMAWAHQAGRDAARTYFEFYHPELTIDELERLLSVIEPRLITPKQSPAHYDPHRNKLAAAMWIAGVSLRQLGLVFGVTRETMLRARDKVLLGNKNRISGPDVQFNRALVMRDFGLTFARKNVGVFEAMTVYMIAKMLKDIPEEAKSEDSGSAYDQIDPQTTLHKTDEAAEQDQPERSAPQPMTAENFWDKVKL
jgi:hypothetical protein